MLMSNPPKSRRYALWFATAAVALATMILIWSFFPGPLAVGKSSAGVTTWDRQAAERYLDSREIWWQGWARTHKDHDTYCISCHTQAPYGLARPVLRTDLSEPAPAGAEQAMLASIEKRVRMWKEVQPFYSDAEYGPGKDEESRNAEAVLNAFILSSYDQRAGRLSETTRMAFANAWALQSQSGPVAGAWVWQNFQYTPWESPESEYHGAALMAEAVGSAPSGYSNDPAIAPNLAALDTYLKRHYDAQPLLNKIVALWAGAYLSDLLTREQREQLVGEIDRLQREDGGWSLADLGTWKRVDNTALVTRSDGYATGLIVLALEENHVSNAAAAIDRGRAWLVANQDRTTGAWPAWSLNKDRDPRSNAGPFMSDAATAYAVLALETRR
jgi:squalene-hopene/tetraprenyl-beta-curcumene cyclase